MNAGKVWDKKIRARTPQTGCHSPALTRKATMAASPQWRVRDGIFCFFRRVHIAPGLTVNLSKSGPSLSLGVRGAHVTLSSSGIRKTIGLPGSGCFYTSKQGWHSGAHTAPQFASANAAPPFQQSGANAAGSPVLLDGYKGWINGGVYSLETTYNRREKSWHIHAHILCDASAALPGAAQKCDFFGEQTYAFTAIKRRIEFDWLRLWRSDCGKARAREPLTWTIDKDRAQFERWVRLGREMALREYVGRTWQPIAGLSAEETARRTEWNRNYRRVIDIRPVNDRDKAAKEVLKYVTKGAQFSDNPGADPRTGLGGAVEVFCDATKGARFVQTFGTWYGAQFDTNFDTNHLDDWGERKCTCGLNIWERMGVFHRGDVVMDEAGRWHLRAPLDHRCRGTRGSANHPGIGCASRVIRLGRRVGHVLLLCALHCEGRSRFKWWGRRAYEMGARRRAFVGIKGHVSGGTLEHVSGAHWGTSRGARLGHASGGTVGHVLRVARAQCEGTPLISHLGRGRHVVTN